MTVTVQHGSTVLPADQASVSQLIDEIVLANSIVTISYSCDDNSPSNSALAPDLTDTTHLEISRVASTGAPEITVFWQVVSGPEFTVQRGWVEVDADPTDETITEVDLTKSWLICYSYKSGTGWNGDDFVSVKYEDSTTLRFRCTAAASGVMAAYQAVQYQDCSVQRGAQHFDTGDLTDSNVINTVDARKSILLTTMRSDNGTTANIGQKLYRASLATTGAYGSEQSAAVDFLRQNSGQAMDFEWEVVTFTDDTITDFFTLNFGSASTNTNTAGAMNQTIEKLWGFATGFNYCSGATEYSADDNLGPGAFQLDPSVDLGADEWEVQIDRAITGSVDTLLYFQAIIWAPDPTDPAAIAAHFSSSNRAGMMGIMD
jgi:hypothetical protein